MLRVKNDNTKKESAILTLKEGADRHTSTDKAFNVIREAIVNGNLQPSQRLVESEITKKFGIGRTPVREAMKRLEALGYLERLPGGGLMVVSHSQSQIRNIFEVQEALECMAVWLACTRATEEQLNKATEYHNASKEFLPVQGQDPTPHNELNSAFHRELYGASGNERLVSLINIYGMDQFLYKRLYRVFTSEDWRTFDRQHGCILKAICQRDQHKAQEEMREHIRTCMTIAMTRLL